jgi:hypothetical protein
MNFIPLKIPVDKNRIPRIKPEATISPLLIPPTMTRVPIAFIGSMGMGIR